MKYIMVLLSVSFAPRVLAAQNRSIDIKNQSEQIVLISYREPAGAVIEKILPKQSITILSTTPVLAIRNQGQIERFSIQHGHHHFVITTAASKCKQGLKIAEYNDRHIARSKNDCFDDGSKMFQ